MDANQFDGLVRSWTMAGSRRGTLAAAFGGLLSLLAIAESQAKGKKKKKKPCPPCKKRKKGKCKGTLPDGTACPGGLCQGGACRATSSPPPPCSRNCDGKACGDDGCGGSCGSCNAGEACIAGRCAACTADTDCPAPPPCRDRVCRQGRCETAPRPAGTPCQSEQFCTVDATCDGAGACGGTPRSCDDGIACTDDACDEAGRICVHAANDDHCGASERCDPVADCVCQSGFTRCGTQCTAMIGQACTTGQPGICAQGTVQCVGDSLACVRNQQPRAETCNGLDDDCDGLVDEGLLCPSPPNADGICDQGRCTFICHADYGDCDDDPSNGCEADLTSDLGNCGACGVRCTGPCMPGGEQGTWNCVARQCVCS